tara:strand:+ start:232 stop:525 length:294 start_codon:yes stop_codon:yes gene_type:complete
MYLNSKNKQQEIDILKTNVKDLQKQLSQSYIDIKEKLDIIESIEKKNKELEAKIIEYQKMIPDVMDSKTRVTATKDSVAVTKLNKYGIPIPSGEDFK